MNLRLILTRHAKSSWDDPQKDDHARVLNARGRKSAPAIAGWIEKQGAVPDVILCSDAARTVETCDLMRDVWDARPEVIYLPRLYHASPDTILAAVAGQDKPVVQVIGHNPGIGELAYLLAAKRSDQQRFANFPTCATVIFDAPIAHWSDLRFGAGTVMGFAVPRDLIGGEND